MKKNKFAKSDFFISHDLTIILLTLYVKYIIDTQKKRNYHDKHEIYNSLVMSQKFIVLRTALQ